MAAPLKRVCHQTVRQTSRCPNRTHHRTARCFSIGPSRSAQSAFEDAKDLDYRTSDISGMAHTELQTHRELRQMARVAAWEMPLLSRLSRPYTKPDVYQTPLRWRYTTYMGEAHPASRKVVVEFYIEHIRQHFTDQQSTQDASESVVGDRESSTDSIQFAKFKKLLGARLNHATGLVKMSCENFETQAQNKRYLGDVIQELIREAKDPNADSFEDIPIDTRHVKKKRSLSFPKEWLLTEERKRMLDAKRQVRLLNEAKKVEEGRLISGVQAIAMAERELEEKAASLAQVEVLATAGAQGAPKGRTMRSGIGARRR